MSIASGPLSVAILALPDFVPFDLSVPFQIFSEARRPDGEPAYDPAFYGPAPVAQSGAIRIADCRPLPDLEECGLIVVPGLMDPLTFRHDGVAKALKAAVSRGGRVASICTGAFVLASSGLLDGLSATTHWACTAALAAAFPRVRVEEDVLFVDNGQILTSAGLAAGMDLCFHLIERDHGAAAAERSRDFFVSPLARDGGQRQRLRRPDQPENNLEPLRIWLLENLHNAVTVEDMAKRACMSPRSLHRRFIEQTGCPPMTWLTRARIRRARVLLETGTLGIEQIATMTGFATAAAFRTRFRQESGLCPTLWRRDHAGRHAGDASENLD